MIIVITSFFYFFFFNDTATTEIYTLSLHDALPIAPTKLVTLGDEVEVMVLEIDEDKRRISLGMKQCKANPWQEFAQNTKRGDRVKGPIKSITDFGEIGRASCRERG